ncbi:MAG: hypothetical protein ABIQ00_18065 [Chitinophagaceae bacterium]
MAILASIAMASSIGAYLFFKPHRDVQAAIAFAKLKKSELVSEFIADANKANAKYLASDGNSKVLIVAGRVGKLSDNQNGESNCVERRGCNDWCKRNIYQRNNGDYTVN